MTTIQFDPPIFGTHKQTGLPVSVIAMNWEASSALLLYVNDEGYLDIAPPQEIRTDWRYDMVEEEWYDAVVRAQEDMAGTDGESQDG